MSSSSPTCPEGDQPATEAIPELSRGALHRLRLGLGLVPASIVLCVALLLLGGGATSLVRRLPSSSDLLFALVAGLLLLMAGTALCLSAPRGKLTMAICLGVEFGSVTMLFGDSDYIPPMLGLVIFMFSVFHFQLGRELSSQSLMAFFVWTWKSLLLGVVAGALILALLKILSWLSLDPLLVMLSTIIGVFCAGLPIANGILCYFRCFLVAMKQCGALLRGPGNELQVPRSVV